MRHIRREELRTDYDLAYARRRNVEHCTLLLTRDGGVQWVDFEVIIRTEDGMFHQEVIESANFSHPRHEDQDGRRVGRVTRVFEAYALK